jgi:hypothetical protein
MSDMPMTGAEHYREAEKLVEYADNMMDGLPTPEYANLMAAAQVHATLAVAAAITRAGDRP